MLLNSSVGLGERGSRIQHISFRFSLGVLEDEAVYTFFTVSRTEEAGQTLISQDFRDRYRARIQRDIVRGLPLVGLCTQGRCSKQGW
jgi:hypothetical protein